MKNSAVVLVGCMAGLLLVGACASGEQSVVQIDPTTTLPATTIPGTLLADDSAPTSVVAEVDTNREPAADQARFSLEAETVEGWKFKATMAIPQGRFDGLITATTQKGFLAFDIDPAATEGFEYELDNPGRHIVISNTLLVWPVGPEETSVDALNAAQQRLVPRMIDADPDFTCGRGGIHIPLLVDFEPFPLLGNRPLLFCKVHPPAVYPLPEEIYNSNSADGEDPVQMDALARIVNEETPYFVATILAPGSERFGGCFLVIDLADLASASAAIDCTPTIAG